MKITTKKGEKILLDTEDFTACNRYQWYVNKNGYAANDSKPRKLMHRLVMGFPKENIDHANGNKLDNRKSNLRLCNQSQNTSNASKRKTNKSGYKGVSWNKRYTKWESYLTFNYKHIFLGYYDTKEKAAYAYNLKAKEVWGEYAKLNKLKFDIETNN